MSTVSLTSILIILGKIYREHLSACTSIDIAII
jgi:hypothetical protein